MLYAVGPEDLGRQLRRARQHLGLSLRDVHAVTRAFDSFDHSAAHGFIELFGLPLRTQTSVQGALEDEAPLQVERHALRRDA